MSVLNKYNQRVIAILGTTTIVALSIIIIAVAVILVRDLMQTPSSRTVDTGLTLEETQAGDSLIRDQAINFKKPIRIDSARQLYAIPVSQVKLEKPEKVRSSLSFKAERKLNVDTYYNDDLNNLMIFDLKTIENRIVFNQKTFIEEYQVITVDEKPYLIISATQKDSNQNGLLNGADLQTLFIYDVLKSDLKRIEQPGKGLWSFNQLYETSNIIAHYKVDKNKNGSTESSTEPAYLAIISLLNFEVKPMVNQVQVDQLQHLVD